MSRSRLAITLAAMLALGLAGLWHGSRGVDDAALAPAPVAHPVATTAAPALPAAVAPAVPRDPSEWQGMLVSTEHRALCDTSARCGLAAACVEGLCGACTRDDQCGAGEVCTLDHCLARDNVACHSRTECGAEQLCVLSGYSADPRGNRDLTARCLSPSGAAETVQIADVQAIPSARPEVDPRELQDEARRAALADREVAR